MKTLTRILTFGFVGSGIGACVMALIILINGSNPEAYIVSIHKR